MPNIVITASEIKGRINFNSSILDHPSSASVTVKSTCGMFCFALS